MTDLENKNPNENGINSQDSTTNNDISKSLNDENFSQTLNSQPEMDINQSIPENKSEVNSVLNGATQNESSTQNSSDMGGNSNEIFLGKFENEMINTIDKKDTDNTNSADYPNPINYQINTGESEESQVDNQEAEKTKLAQKEKLIHLIKSHESKANKKGLINGILIGVLCSIIILALGVLFAKDQIVNLLDSGNNSENNCIITEKYSDEINQTETDITTTDESTADETTTDGSITDESTADETTTDEITTDGITTDEITTDETTTDEITTDETITDETITDETITDETITDETTTDESTTDETSTDVATTDVATTDVTSTDESTTDESTTNSEETSTEETNVSITHVNTPEEANWVLPAHCSDLTCYGEDKEFSPCTTFKLVENLDENAHRIGNNGSCRYKDNSELVYVEISK